MNVEMVITTTIVMFALGLGAIVLVNVLSTQLAKKVKPAKVQTYNQAKLVRVSAKEVYASFGAQSKPAKQKALSSRDKRKAKGIARRAMAQLAANHQCCITCHRNRIELAIHNIEEVVRIERQGNRIEGRIANCNIRFA